MPNPHPLPLETEEGFISILGCCMLLALLLCGMILMHMSKNEVEALHRYHAEVQLFHAAKSCMEQAVLSLENQQLTEISDTYKDTVCILDTRFPDNADDIHVAVYAREKEGALLLMSRAELDTLWGSPGYQAVYGYMKKEGDYYVWTGWFEQNR